MEGSKRHQGRRDDETLLGMSKRIYESLLDGVINTLRKEPPIIRVKAVKAIVVGDLHGDLNTFAKIMSAYNPKEYTYVFMGDYIDRGSKSTELLAMMLSTKYAFPNSFIMLRGDHESQLYGISPQQFPYEFMDKMGNMDLLKKIYGELFTELPMAAVLNDKYFIVHGGIPVNGEYLEQIEALGGGKAKVLYDNGLYLQMAWGDPTTKDGVSPTWRGDENRIRCFGPDIAAGFLRDNNMDLIIRGHTHRLGGLRLIGRTLTVLSTNEYEGDKPYVVKIDNGKLGIYRVGSEGPSFVGSIADLARRDSEMEK
jgi:predicted phosphodiesterase